MTPQLPFTVSAPASSGNLGPGFDVLAMALELRNEVKVSRGSGKISVEGRDADVLPTDNTNLVAQAFERACGKSLSEAGVDLRCLNLIPSARGLGSSTAAAACGLLAGWSFSEHDWDDDELFDCLVELDGHADNAAACAYGGVVLCHVGAPNEKTDVVALGAIDWLNPIVVIPDRRLPTADARGALPKTYDRSTVVRALGAASLLVGGLLGGHPELVEDALEQDVLHEPQRSVLVPELVQVREAASHTPALGSTLSGAGPSVLVWSEPRDVDQIVGSLQIDFPEHEIVSIPCTPTGAYTH